MNDARARRIEAECHRLLTRFALAVDAHEADEVAAVFAADGVWHHQGQAYRGRDAIRGAVIERARTSPSLISRHHYGNVLIRVRDETRAEGRAYYTVYRHEGDGDLALPRPLQKIRIGEYQNTFVLTPEGWRIASKIALRVLEQT